MMEGSKKIIAPIALNSLVEALANIYWYKNDLKSFIFNTLTDKTLLGKINWDDYKRNICSTLITLLSSDQTQYKQELLTLIFEVTKINDFSHLQRLEGGDKKVKTAQETVQALRKQMEGFKEITEEVRKHTERKQVAQQKLKKIKDVAKGLQEIKSIFFQLLGSVDPQGRGYLLEKIFGDLFQLFDLDPKASFRIKGEQIDGAFTFENSDYLFEGKWQKALCDIQDLDAFSGKISRRLENTLGLFCSINGFSDDAIQAHSTGRRLMILMDGADLMAVLEERIDLLQLLLRKRKHAAQTGNIYLRINDILQDRD